MLHSVRNLCTRRAGAAPPNTAILMLNMGGPQTTKEVHDFLTRLFTDRDIMKLPLQGILGPLIAKRRAPNIEKKYEQIGGGSPILRYTQRQGDLLTSLLDSMSPSTAPHKAYVGFRYAVPFSSAALERIKNDDVKRVVVFSQYPQYSCSTTGSSLNQLRRDVANHPELHDLRWSFIDRWPLNEGLIDAFVDSIDAQLHKINKSSRDSVVLLFTAHSLPLDVVARGDTYPHEVAATVMAIMKKLNNRYPFRLVWQSKVGPIPWLAPKTDEAIKAFVAQGRRTLLMIPVSFVNEHIETLHELDIEYGEELAKSLNLEKIYRAEAPNYNSKFIRGLADEVKQHLDSNIIAKPQLMMKCPHCVNPDCTKLRDWLSNLD